ncbi:hypothetical protein TIFTF001_030299 [Ficus carica]|uniref:Uncharacterized protein n=1 Tax=Ficus carica TaxID=3494 RepID=A0AA88DTK1_FICCA|nr:hypothetical protein TIFTF001_030299 [Ficus carica]
MVALYLARFKMPTVALYDGFTDADEYLENYHAHMLIQNANEATLYKAFCLTPSWTALLGSGRFCQYTPLVAMVEHVMNQISRGGLLQEPPPIRIDRTRRNQNKYCNFDKDVGHETKDCIQLRDQIELLVRDGHLQEFFEKAITPASRANRTGQVRPHLSSGMGDQTNAGETEHIVHTIFGGTATDDTTSGRRSYARDARQVARGEYINMAKHIAKISRQDSVPITFTDDEANKLLHPQNDALVGEIKINDNTVRLVLINNGSSADILFMDTFTRLKIDIAILAPTQTPLYGFASECV